VPTSTPLNPGIPPTVYAREEGCATQEGSTLVPGAVVGSTRPLLWGGGRLAAESSKQANRRTTFQPSTGALPVSTDARRAPVVAARSARARTAAGWVTLCLRMRGPSRFAGPPCVYGCAAGRQKGGRGYHSRRKKPQLGPGAPASNGCVWDRAGGTPSSSVARLQ
jgi:hypothetical protein